MAEYNSEGYPNPTFAESMVNIAKEEKASDFKPCVFICSPFAGDTRRNLENARRYLKFAVDIGAIPFAPHLLYPQVLDDLDPRERELGLGFGMVWLGKCDELWVFGRRVSGGMSAEIAGARKTNIPVRYFTESCEEVHDL